MRTRILLLTAALLLVATGACRPGNETNLPKRTPTAVLALTQASLPTHTATPANPPVETQKPPTPTSGPAPTTAPAATSAPLPTASPGGPSLLGFGDGAFFRYALASGTRQPLALPISGEIDSARLSPDGRWLVFIDQAGIWLSERPFENVRLVTAGLGHWGIIWGSAAAFSHDSTRLAFSDQEGLKLLDLSGGEPTLVISHYLHTGTDPDQNHFHHRFYHPSTWVDPDWIVVRIGGWEVCQYVLLYLPEGALREFPEACSPLDWLPGRGLFTLSIAWSPSSQHNDQVGLHINAISGSQVMARRAYSGPLSPPGPPEWLTRDSRFSPDGSWVSFVDIAHRYTQNETSRLMLIRPEGGEAQTLLTAAGLLATPVWMPGGESILVIHQPAWNSPVQVLLVDLETGQAQPYPLPVSQVFLTWASVSPDGLWAAAKQCPNEGSQACGLLLFNTATGQAVTVVDEGFFLGWEPRP
jgi:hypothetical protein